MGALSVGNPNLVWQNVAKAVANENSVTQNCFRQLKIALSQQYGNKDLQFLAFTEAQADAAGGTVLVTGAMTLYAFFAKKENSATDNWTWLYDDATDDTTAAPAMFCLPCLRANETNFAISPAGFALTLGIVVTQYATDPLGASDGSTGANGFVIVGV